MNEYKNTLDETVLEEGTLLQKINRITAKSVTQESYDELLQVFKDNKDAILEHEQKIVQKIPFLGDLPVIGSIFRSTSTAKAKSELVIMITPKIINDDESTVASTTL